MAYITIPGDSDGDLHDAAMHNSKFGAIASVLNGNIDLENLANPKSIGFFRFSLTGFVSNFPYDLTSISAGTITTPVSGFDEFYAVSSATSHTVAGSIFSASNSANNVLKSSWIRVPKAIVITDVEFLYRQLPGSYTASEDFTIALQRSTGTAITDSYENICSFTEDFRGSATELTVQSPSLSNTSIAEDRFIRIVFTNPSSYTPDLAPPSLVCTVAYKADHTS